MSGAVVFLLLASAVAGAAGQAPSLEDLHAQGAQLFKQGKLPEAADVAARALALAEKIHGPDEVPTAHAALILGIVYAEQKRHPEARAMFMRALEIQKVKLPKFDWRIAETLKGLGDLHRAQGESQLARQAYSEALGVIYGKDQPTPPVAALLALDLAELGDERDDWADAADYRPRQSRSPSAVAIVCARSKAAHSICSDFCK